MAHGGFAIAAGVWTFMVAVYIWTSQSGDEPVGIVDMTEEWASLGVPLLSIAVLSVRPFALAPIPQAAKGRTDPRRASLGESGMSAP